MTATISSYTFLKLFCHYNMIKKFIMVTVTKKIFKLSLLCNHEVQYE